MSRLVTIRGLFGEVRDLVKGPIAIAGSSNVAIRVISIGTGFVSAALAARLLGVNNFGIYAIANTIAALFGGVAVLGFGLLSVRELAQARATENWRRIRGFLRYSQTAVFAGSLMLGALILAAALIGNLGVAHIAPPEDICIAGILVPLISALLLFQDQARGLGAAVAGQLPLGLVRPVLLAAAFAILYGLQLHIGSFTALIIMTGATAVATIHALIVVQRSIPQPVKQVELSERRNWLRSTLPFFLLSLVTILQAQLQTMLLAWLSGPEQVALFQPISRMAPIMVIGLEALAVPMAPRIAHLWTLGDLQQLRRIVQMATLAATATTACVVVATLIAGPWVLGAFGSEYTSAMPALWVIAAAQLINAATGHANVFLIMTNHQNDNLVCQAVGVLAAAIAGLILNGLYGAAGAATAMAIGIAVYNLATLISLRRHFAFDTALPGALRLLMTRG